MKVGDLVRDKDGGYDGAVGIVAEEKDPFSALSSQRRIGIMWAGTNRISYEPRDWLEVISE